MSDIDLGEFVVKEEWRRQESMAAKTMQMSVSSLDMHFANDMTDVVQRVLRQMHKAVEREAPGCAGCQYLSVIQQSDPVSDRTRFGLRCKDFGKTQIKCPDGTTLVRRGEDYGVVKFVAPPINLHNAPFVDTPVPRVTVVAQDEYVLPRSPDLPTGITDAW